jgi:hypothetical protein
LIHTSGSFFCCASAWICVSSSATALKSISTPVCAVYSSKIRASRYAGPDLERRALVVGLARAARDDGEQRPYREQPGGRFPSYRSRH